jgi:signal transduction histidine kinase
MTFEKGKSGYVLIRHEASGEADTCFEELLSLPVKVDNRDAVEWVIAMARDVTREKEMEQQLIHSDRLAALGEMAASVAHEVNNPLGIILGFAQDLLTEVDSTDTRYESLRIIEEETQRCKKIMWNLLEFGRPTPPKFIPVEPEVVIRKSVDFFSTQFQKSRIQSVSYIQKDLPKVWADPQQLEQVLVNLFLNAVDAMPRGGELTVQANVAPVQGCFHDRDPVAASSGEEVRIAVTDTGCGIEPVQMTKIFRPFFTTKSHKGMGLGLPICQRIVSAHGGRIAVESGPLWGTTFLLYFPLERRCRERNL